MTNHLLTLHQPSFPMVWEFLNKRDPWHMIALDALWLYGLNHPEHRWFAELRSGRLQGVIYVHGQLVHFAYDEAPDRHSPLYDFLNRHLPQFTTFGKKEIVEPIVKRLPFHRLTHAEKSWFLRQSSETRKRLNRRVHWPKAVDLRDGRPEDLYALLDMFTGSEFETEIDSRYIHFLLQQRRILVAEYRGSIVGAIMCLKETPRYVLLGNLFVHPQTRNKGIATLLGQQMMLKCMQQGKKVCFFYSKPELKDFYTKAAFQPLGAWVHYSVTSKATM
mgnify:CR=1 FL=1